MEVKDRWTLRQVNKGHRTHKVTLPAEVLEPLQLLWWKLRPRVSGRRIEASLPSEHPVGSRINDGKLQQVQRRP